MLYTILKVIIHKFKFFGIKYHNGAFTIAYLSCGNRKKFENQPSKISILRSQTKDKMILALFSAITSISQH